MRKRGGRTWTIAKGVLILVMGGCVYFLALPKTNVAVQLVAVSVLMLSPYFCAVFFAPLPSIPFAEEKGK